MTASLLAAAAAAVVGAEDKLPFTAEVMVEDFEKYEREIREKADSLVATKRAEIVAKLKAEAAKQSKAGNADAARAILTVVEGWQADADEVKRVAVLAARRWTPLFEPGNLPPAWKMPADPDGGWDYTGGELEMQSLKKYAVVMREVPPGDIVVRAKMKIDPNGDDSKEQQAGIGFIAGKDSLLVAIAQAPGSLLAYAKLGAGEKMLGLEPSTACQRKFTELQVAWIGKRFMIFARGKLIVDADAGEPRGKAALALTANNASGSFRDVEIRVPDKGDVEQLKGGRALD